jgi:plastocyanin
MTRFSTDGRAVRIAIFAFAGLLVLTACGGSKKKTGNVTKDRSITAGYFDLQDKTIAVLAFLPAQTTVSVGAVVTWHFLGPEAHTVTFIAPGGKVPGPNDADATKAIPATGPFDGTKKVSSGLLPTGPKPGQFKLTFAKEGSFTYYCAIHPGMTGKITVVAAGVKTDTRAEVRARAMAEATKWVTEGRAAKQALLKKTPKKTKNADGTTTWTVEMGASTKHTAIFAFAPVPVNLKAGDRVVFVNNSAAPHTASFAGGATLPQNPESPQASNATGKSPLTPTATGFINTGRLLPNSPPGKGPPLSARSFTFKVATAGTYAYVCLLHVNSGMAGTIIAT